MPLDYIYKILTCVVIQFCGAKVRGIVNNISAFLMFAVEYRRVAKGQFLRWPIGTAAPSLYHHSLSYQQPIYNSTNSYSKPAIFSLL
jgi:hypothetical protein